MTDALMRPRGAHPFLYLDAGAEWHPLRCATSGHVTPYPDAAGTIVCEGCDGFLVVEESPAALDSLRFGTFGPPSLDARDYLFLVVSGKQCAYQEFLERGYCGDTDTVEASARISGALAMAQEQGKHHDWETPRRECLPGEQYPELGRGRCWNHALGSYHNGIYWGGLAEGVDADARRSFAAESRTRYLAHLYLTREDDYRAGFEDGERAALEEDDRRILNRSLAVGLGAFAMEYTGRILARRVAK